MKGALDQDFWVPLFKPRRLAWLTARPSVDFGVRTMRRFVVCLAECVAAATAADLDETEIW
jgi:hypothetical protein